MVEIVWSLDVQYHYCLYVVNIVHVVPMMLYTCGVKYIWCCVHIIYAVLCTDGVVGMLDMRCCVQMVLCTCWICNVVYIWCFVHVVYTVLCTYGIACMLYMWCYVHVVLCA